MSRFNHLLSRMLKYELRRQTIEEKVTFMNSLHSEWKMIMSAVKAHEQFKNYSLAQVIRILKIHEDEVMENAKLIFYAGLLAVVAKEESAKGNKSKVTIDDSTLDATDDEFTS